MLFVTTGNNVDSFTAHYVLTHDCGSNGEFFVPFHLPRFSEADLDTFSEQSFGQTVADVLNIFFSARLNGWDVDFCIGRSPVRLVPLSHKIYIAEAWHNPEQDFWLTVRNLSARIRSNREDVDNTYWADNAVRIACLFGTYGQLRKLGILLPGQKLDISVPTGDFSAPMAVWYARQMGLPVENIVCCCQNSSPMWDFIHYGFLEDPLTRQKRCPWEVSLRNFGLEPLIYEVLGIEEAKRYADFLCSGGSYTLNKLALDQMFDGFVFSVVSSRRIKTVIGSTYGSGSYLMDPASALAFGGLQDSRATTGEARVSLIMSENSPVNHIQDVAKVVGIPAEELLERLGAL